MAYQAAGFSLLFLPATLEIIIYNKFAGTMMATKATRGVRTARSKLLTAMARPRAMLRMLLAVARTGRVSWFDLTDADGWNGFRRVVTVRGIRSKSRESAPGTFGP